ncbi:MULTISPECIES: sensor histidine kinase [Bacillaceae]|uniref:histidine kinase n=1 Tax=Evansella alkalicola TaxID=745819 RepID=A0ABS6JYY4_9BACI|nr:MULTISPECIES: HAMP domain-containing sensor histidine kinase [Bacillaceae]MBU9722397.1 HAMP domain-containing histidine kinase [Bacillus alkalicola]
MMRNREFRLLLLVMIVVASLGVVIATIFFSLGAAILIGSLSLILISCTFFFTAWRYRHIEKLSGYLRKISAGDYGLDVRDNEEGELSILKNEMYKVTIMLSEQRSHLLSDKATLTNAISDISHQLKTPITSMTVMSDLLSSANLSDEKRMEFTRNIQVQLERIDWLVTSLLKLSKMDAGTIQFKKELVSVKELLKKATAPLLIPMEIKEQTLVMAGEDNTTFLGDLNWTAEAIINILKNCVEHTPNGGKIDVSYAENPLFTEIIISDTGKGIPKDELPYIFKRFFKGKHASDESVGIGLAMANTIVKSQDGTIEVKKLDLGTEFRLKFYKQVV